MLCVPVMLAWKGPTCKILIPTEVPCSFALDFNGTKIWHPVHAFPIHYALEQFRESLWDIFNLSCSTASLANSHIAWLVVLGGSFS